MNAKISVLFIWVEAIIYLLLYNNNMHDCTFNGKLRFFAVRIEPNQFT